MYYLCCHVGGTSILMKCWHPGLDHSPVQITQWANRHGGFHFAISFISISQRYEDEEGQEQDTEYDTPDQEQSYTPVLNSGNIKYCSTACLSKTEIHGKILHKIITRTLRFSLIESNIARSGCSISVLVMQMQVTQILELQIDSWWQQKSLRPGAHLLNGILGWQWSSTLGTFCQLYRVSTSQCSDHLPDRMDMADMSYNDQFEDWNVSSLEPRNLQRPWRISEIVEATLPEQISQGSALHGTGFDSLHSLDSLSCSRNLLWRYGSFQSPFPWIQVLLQ